MPRSPTSRSQHSLNTMPDDTPHDSNSAFPRYHDDENISSEDDTLMVDADESAPFLRPGSSELGDLSDDELSPQKNWILKHIPPRIRKAGRTAWRWTKGPNPPRIYKIRPFFPVVQEAPIKLLDRYLPKRRHKFLLLLASYFIWLLSFSLVLRKSAFSSDVPGYGSPVRIGCGARYWYESRSSLTGHAHNAQGRQERLRLERR